MEIITRREFLGKAGCGLVTAAALNLGLEKLGLIAAHAQVAAAPSDFRALVCIFMSGGNDANNMIVPMDTAAYGDYYAARNPSGLALQKAALAPTQIQPLSISIPFALHPSLAPLKTYFDNGQMAVVCNVGPLVEPLDRTTYRNGSKKRPYQLFSHSDQVEIFQTASAFTKIQNGWGGRLGDKIVSLNGGNAYPVNTSISGSVIFGRGQTTRPLSIGTGALNQILVLNGFTPTTAERTARRTAFDNLRGLDRPVTQPTLLTATQDMTTSALSIQSALATDPALTTVFPNTGLGNQLKQVAKLIKLNLTSPGLSLNRMIFFTSIGGFDTHQNELTSHTTLYGQIAAALDAFYKATVELAVANRVTAFTMSDFGRTFQPSGTGGGVGTDHGWGSHSLVLGGSVKGTDFYGENGPNGNPFPVLQLSGPCDTDSRGRWIPNTAVDQMATTLAKWFGVTAPADLQYVAPLIGNFARSDLGFML
jgi:uncharacterized protein (DUF1501 family)